MLNRKHLRSKEKTAQAQAKLDEQPGDFWVFPFQFGKRWRGYSVRNAQVRFAKKEFGLGPYEVAILLLTHPDRITDSGHLCICCAGYEYAPFSNGDFLPVLSSAGAVSADHWDWTIPEPTMSMSGGVLCPVASRGEELWSLGNLFLVKNLFPWLFFIF